MAKVFGTMNLDVLVDVDSDEETLGLLQANYKINPERFVGYELYGINCNGERHKINACGCSDTDLTEFID